MAPEEASRLSERLSQSEVDRAARFLRVEDRMRYLAAHDMLRRILEYYLAVPAKDLVFRENKFGKPEIANLPCGGRLAFNLAHSGDFAVLAVGRDLQVGIDIEEICLGSDFIEVAERLFSEPEVEDLKKVPPEEQPELFFRYWTRKEAYVKARGEGLSCSLRDFSVSGTPPLQRCINNHPDEVKQWSIFDLDINEGYASALATEGCVEKITVRDFSTNRVISSL
ncbi:MAG: 4'-phosphopantetheinyl transferase superfamily protein [Nibricoccus sp.]